MIDQKGLYALFDAKAIRYTAYEHQAVFTADQAVGIPVPLEGVFVKNLFLCDKRKRSFYLVTTPLDVRTDLKALAEGMGLPRLGFVSESLLWPMLGVLPGSVTPFALLNDETRAITQIFDTALVGKRIGAHPMVNTATVYVDFDDTVALIEEHGNPVRYFDRASRQPFAPEEGSATHE